MMVLLALLIDLIAAGSYYLQLTNPSAGLELIALVLQGLFTIVLVVMAVSYSGKRYARIQTNLFYKVLSIRYALIVVSALLNGVMLFLYVLNFMGINDIVFSGF